MNKKTLRSFYKLKIYIKNGVVYGYTLPTKKQTIQAILEFRKIPLDKKHLKIYSRHNTTKNPRKQYDFELLVKEMIQHKK